MLIRINEISNERKEREKLSSLLGLGSRLGSMGGPRPFLLLRHNVCDATRSFDLFLSRGAVRRSVHGDRSGQLAGSQDLERELVLATTYWARRGPSE